MRPSTPLLLLSLASILALSACAGEADANDRSIAPIVATPTATSSVVPTEPTEPDSISTSTTPRLSELVVGPNGIAPLTIGEVPPVVDPKSDILVYRADGCQWAVEEGSLPADLAGRWFPNYERQPWETGPFGVQVDDGILKFVRVYTKEIATEAGIHLESALTDLDAAYGSALIYSDSEGGLDQYRLPGKTGDLIFYVVSPAAVEYYPEYGGEVIVMLVVVPRGYEPPLGGSDWGVFGACTGP